MTMAYQTYRAARYGHVRRYHAADPNRRYWIAMCGARINRVFSLTDFEYLSEDVRCKACRAKLNKEAS